MKRQPKEKAHSTAATGRDSLGKAVRRNLAPGKAAGLLRRGAATLKNEGWQALWREVAFRFNLALHRETWRHRADMPLRKTLRAQRKARFEHTPLVSVLVPLYNTPPAYLRQMIESVLAQSYAYFELVLADGSDAAHAEVGQLARRFAEKDARVRYVRLEKNAGIAGNTNAALQHSTGAWLLLLDHDDVLQPNALFEVVCAANATGAELIYSDEVVLDASLKHLCEFHFKGGYAPDTLRGCNVITHLCAFSRALLVRAGGGERAQYNGAQDYELILRLSEQARGIHHIPKVLYIWRSHGGSTAEDIAQKPEAIEAGAAALAAHLERVSLAGTVQPLGDHPGAYRVHYPVLGEPLVTVLIPNSDHSEDLARCLSSLYARGGWPLMEVLVIDNNSSDMATAAFYKEATKKYPGLRVLDWPGPFNFSAINNFGVEYALGDHLLLLNNDVEVLSDGFVAELLSYSQRHDVGAVGPMLYYPDNTVQHAGLILGIGQTAGVSHKGHARGDGGDMFRLCTTQNVSAVTGAALMVKRPLYEALGGLDDAHFAVAFNDVDFCLRLRQEGLWNVFTPFAQAIHYESKSRGYDTEGPRRERFEREAAVFREKYAAELAAGDPFYNPHFTLEHENFGYR
ncbi:MAG: glycosyltransferase family 2 protein [Oscillospiraceae bacterium]